MNSRCAGALGVLVWVDDMPHQEFGYYRVCRALGPGASTDISYLMD